MTSTWSECPLLYCCYCHALFPPWSWGPLCQRHPGLSSCAIRDLLLKIYLCFTIITHTLLYLSNPFNYPINSRDCSNDEVLSDPEARKEIIAAITLATNATKKKATKKKKRKNEEEEEEEEERPAKKASKKEVPLKSEEVTDDDDGTSDENEKGESSPIEQQWVGCDR